MEEMNEELVSALISGGKAWVVLTIAAVMPTLWAMALTSRAAAAGWAGRAVPEDCR